MLASSSPIAYPLSSSPPVQLGGRKRPAESNAPLKHKKRLFENSSLLPVRDPNYHDRHDARKNCPVQEISGQIQPKSNLGGPFIDDEDDENAGDSGRITYLQGPRDSSNLLSNRSMALGSAKPCSPQVQVTTTSGQEFRLKRKNPGTRLSYERLVAERSTTEPGKATKSFYGIEIHKLVEKSMESPEVGNRRPDINNVIRPTIEHPFSKRGGRSGRTLMWTEKYRARKFMDLVGDERTHREVLRWIKHWDPIVFPGNNKPKSKPFNDKTEDRSPCKILLLAGPPGLGKTTLAHVCARQAGYEVVEINASDERSRDVVRGRIRDLVSTENVRGVKTKTADDTVRKAGRPVCVVVDEVDGVAGGNGAGGEGGFVKALIDLVTLDQKNSDMISKGMHLASLKRKRKGDQFRLLRPMVLICNDVYHPALRPLRSSGVADVVHVRKPPMDKVVTRMKAVFETEGIPCDSDAIRRLCEATWGVPNRTENRLTVPGIGEGDIRGLLVVGEWVAAKMRAQDPSAITKSAKLTRQWVQQHVLQDLTLNGSASRNLGRGGAKEAVERVFQHNAGFPRDLVPNPSVANRPAGIAGSLGVSEAGKSNAIERLGDLVESSGECDRITTDCFTAYASRSFQDDTLLSKPCAAYDWLHFHDSLSARIYSGQEWELSPYLSQSALGFHNLFASAPRHTWGVEESRLGHDDKQESIPFSGPRADYEASEIQKQNKAILEAFQSSLAIPLARSFRSNRGIVIDLLPSLLRILNPNIRPTIVGGSGEHGGIVSVRRKEERGMLERAVNVMSDVGVTFERNRVEAAHGAGSNYVYRMEPPVDTLTSFETASSDGAAISMTRYAVRQALDQEYQKTRMSQTANTGRVRLGVNGAYHEALHISRNVGNDSRSLDEKGPATVVKRDFFGRIVQDLPGSEEEAKEIGQEGCSQHVDPKRESRGKVFISFHEGYSNAVRKPITFRALMGGL
ncbi:MAG: hypothetical protein Q9170_007412 [Blastenia crenularia]